VPKPPVLVPNPVLVRGAPPPSGAPKDNGFTAAVLVPKPPKPDAVVVVPPKPEPKPLKPVLDGVDVLPNAEPKPPNPVLGCDVAVPNAVVPVPPNPPLG
jgi:hypothetical protein